MKGQLAARQFEMACYSQMLLDVMHPSHRPFFEDHQVRKAEEEFDLVMLELMEINKALAL